MAEIHKINNWPTTPKLLMDMIGVNLGPLTSIVISVENEDGVGVYWTPMDQGQMAWHMYRVQDELSGVLSGNDDEG